MKNILITGGTGFIGSRLLSRLIELKPLIDLGEIHITSRDIVENPLDGIIYHYGSLNDRFLLEKIFSNRFDIIYHCAGKATGYSTQDSLFLYNVLVTHNILQFIQEGTNLVFTSSSAVYGHGDTNEDSPPMPSNYYGACKLACENLISTSAFLGKVNSQILRLPAVVGKGASHGLLPDIIRKLQSGSNEIELYGPRPGSIKPFLFVKDLVEVMIYYGQEIEKGQNSVINISPHDTISVEHVLGVVEKVMGIYKTVNWLDKSIYPGDVGFIRINNNNMISELPSELEVCLSSAENIKRATKEILEK